MAEINFSRHVPGVAPGAELPSAVSRREKVQVSNIPDWQSALSNYGSQTNWMSTLGSTVAARASNALASKIGNELGKNPQGDVGIPLTQFDKTFQESYQTQAQATLALQANKLISESNIKLAESPRLSSGLIAKTNQQISIGLQNIFKNAPTEIRPHLEYQFQSQQLNQAEQATKRMIGEQREDQKENLLASNSKYNQTIYELARSGNEKAAESALASVKKNNKVGAEAHTTSPSAAQLAIDSAQKTFDAGVYGAKADQARSAGKYEEFSKQLAEKPPTGMSYDRWQAVMTNVSNENAQIHNMKMQSEQIALSQFKLDIMENPNSPDIAAKLQQLKESVSNNSFIEAEIGLLNIQAKANKENNGANALANHWTDIGAYNEASAKDRDKAFASLTRAYVAQAQTNGLNVSEPEAEVNIAAQAPGPIKGYVDKLNTKAHSGNPMLMEEAGYAIEHLHEVGKGDVLQGIDDKTVSMLDKFNALKQIMPMQEAAEESKRIVYGKTPDEVAATQQAWTDYVKKAKSRGETDSHFFFNMAGLSEKDFVRFPAAYAKQLENTYHAYFDNLGGDAVTAQKQLQRTIDTVYGYTNINGHDKEYTIYPLEKAIGLPDNAKGVILNDVADQIKEQFVFTNEQYKAGKGDWFFEVSHRPSVIQPTDGQLIDPATPNLKLRLEGAKEKRLSNLEASGVEVIQHFRDGTVKKYQTVVQASPFATKTADPNNPIVGGYDVLLKDDQGTKNISVANPLSGGVTYHPRVQKIKNEYGYIMHSQRDMK